MHRKALFLIVLASFLISCQEQENETPCPSEVNVRFINKFDYIKYVEGVTITFDNRKLYIPRGESIKSVPGSGFEWKADVVSIEFSDTIKLAGTITIEEDSCIANREAEFVKTVEITIDNIVNDYRDIVIGKYMIVCDWKDKPDYAPTGPWIYGSYTLNMEFVKCGFKNIGAGGCGWVWRMGSTYCFGYDPGSLRNQLSGCFFPESDSIRYSEYNYPNRHTICTGKKIE